MKVFSSFLDIICSFKIRSAGEGRKWWTPYRSQAFKFFFFYVGKIFLQCSTCQQWLILPLEKYSEGHGPQKIGIFHMDSGIRKDLVRDNVRKMNIVFVDWCYIFKESGETIDHVLFHSDITWGLWSMLFCPFGIYWLMPNRVLDF